MSQPSRLGPFVCAEYWPPGSPRGGSDLGTLGATGRGGAGAGAKEMHQVAMPGAPSSFLLLLVRHLLLEAMHLLLVASCYY